MLPARVGPYPKTRPSPIAAYPLPIRRGIFSRPLKNNAVEKSRRQCTAYVVPSRMETDKCLGGDRVAAFAGLEEARPIFYSSIS
jgi:hypothetical protein